MCKSKFWVVVIISKYLLTIIHFATSATVHFLYVQVRHYLRRLREFCFQFRDPRDNRIKMPLSVTCTATHYFCRFYLYNSVMDYHPKEIMLVYPSPTSKLWFIVSVVMFHFISAESCIYLSCICENVLLPRSLYFLVLLLKWTLALIV